jgi:polar amino acid transport system substrate-binding protein
VGVRVTTGRGKSQLFALLLFSAALAGAQEIVPFAVGEWEPYVGLSLPENGTAARIVSASCQAAGLTARFEFYPWARAERRVLEGLAFASFPYQRISEKEDRFFFSDEILRSTVAILRANGETRTASFVYRGKAEEFVPFVVGTTTGSEAITAPLKRAGVQVEETPTVDQSIQKLERRRIQFVIDERAVIEDSIRRLYPGRADLFVFMDRDFTEPRGYRLLVSKEFPGAVRLLERFNAGLAKIKTEAKR